MGAGAAPGAQSPLAGKRVMVLGAGGAGRALAFGAIEKGAHVIVANRWVPGSCYHAQNHAQ